MNILKKHIVVFEPTGLRILVDDQSTFLDAVRMIGLHLPADCGGAGTCGKCALLLDPSPEPKSEDVKHIEQKELRKGVRLACQHEVKVDTRAFLVSKRREMKILTEGDSRIKEWVPDLGNEGYYGIAIDLGTTTLVGYLLELDSGTQIRQIASLNPQVIIGEDVVSRITYAIQEQDGLIDLKERVTSEIDLMINSLLEESEINIEKLVRISIVGNTVMQHLFLGADVEPLSLAPYEPSVRGAILTSGLEVGLISKNSEVYLPPNIAGYVGGDTVGFILSERLDLSNEIVLGIDVGTNGEIVLSNRGALSCCSTAAGPAFEGATIRHGMRGQEGAIEHVVIHDPDNPPEITVIGDKPPRGICGSAIVDIAAEMRLSGLIDNSGRIQTISSRVYDDNDFGRSYLLIDDEASSRQISFTQKDVRQVQLAKAAINTGALILLQEAGLKIHDIDSVMLAGAFGSYIRPESALRIGLLPLIERDRIIQVGNAAGEGAKALLISSKAREIAQDFVSKIRYVELAAHDDFQSMFLESIPFH